MRTKLAETPVFKVKEKNTSFFEPLKQIRKDYLKPLFASFTIILFVASNVILALYFPTFLNTYFQFDRAKVLSANTWSLVWVALIFPFCGSLGDRFGHKKVFTLSGTLFCLLMPLFVCLLRSGSDWALYVFIALYQTIEAPFVATYLTTVSRAFPTSARYTAVALCYNLAYCCAAFIPSGITYLFHIGMPINYVSFAPFVIVVGLGLNALFRVQNLEEG